MRIRINIAAWKHFVEPMLNMLIPSLLSPNNMPILADRHQCSFDICTTVNLFDELASHPAIGKLVEHADVTFVPVDDISRRKPHRVLIDAHRHTLASAAADGAGCMFLQPDTIVADGSLRWMSDVICDTEAVLIAPPRAIIGNVASICRKYRRGDSLVIQPRELMRIMLDHQHPITTSLIINSNKSSNWPSHLYWQVGTDGLLVRAFHLHPIYLVPNESSLNDTIDGDYLKQDDNITYVTSSDDMAILEMSHPGHMWRTIEHSPATVESVKKWVDQHPTPLHKTHAATSSRLIADITDEREWKDAERAADKFYADVIS